MEKEKLIKELIEQEKLCFNDTKNQGVVAWMKWFTKDITIIEEKHKPNVVGEKDVKELFEGVYKLDNFEIDWDSFSADVSNDATLGYTIGKYSLKYKLEGKPYNQIGKYLFIWKKCDGEWKIDLDMINEYTIG